MNTLLLYAHSGWRYVVIFFTLAALAKFLIGLLGRSAWSDWDQRLGQGVPLVFDLQLLLGAIFWIMLGGWQLPAQQAWEHPLTMLVAAAVVHLTWIVVKRAPLAAQKFRSGFAGYLIGAVVLGFGVWRITNG